jgi:hypothetical protein
MPNLIPDIDPKIIGLNALRQQQRTGRLGFSSDF